MHLADGAHNGDGCASREAAVAAVPAARGAVEEVLLADAEPSTAMAPAAMAARHVAWSSPGAAAASRVPYSSKVPGWR